MAADLARFVTGGATRPDSITGFQPDFATSLAALFAAAPPEVQQNLLISSGYRSPERQTQLWEQALAKYGSPEKARKWVAPPGRSQHNHGHAADLKFASDAARQWAHQNAAQYGLAFPMGHEPWHVELASARGGKGPASAPPARAAAIAGMMGPTKANAAALPAAAPTIAPMFADAPAAPDLGSVIFSAMQRTQEGRRRAEEEAAADQARRQALFGGGSGGIASLFG